ncbi:transcription factor VIP1-like [Andrographis paniculata]|uniref:transcription factor VIP1-like n=1 Tax=Andrographis paniculata TaxID=175694 RepID=UPI0021E823D3|nr:transcription factor VIP1-like [Andrographis paniculata]
MMDPNFAGKVVSSTLYVPGRTDLDQMSDIPTRGTHHRRAHSETVFRFTDLDDDMLLDNVMADLKFEAPSHLPNVAPAPQLSQTQETKPAPHLRSLSVGADFFEGLDLDGPGPPPPPPESTPRPLHRHSNSIDGYSSATSPELDFNLKKVVAAERLAELALIDPKRAKRILANRQSAARSKERKTHYTNELERRVQTLQSEATTLSAQITLLQRDTTGLSAENKELKLKLQAMEQQARLRDALNEALKDEVQWLKIAAINIPGVNGNSRGPPSFQFSTQFSNHRERQQQQQPHSGPNHCV